MSVPPIDTPVSSFEVRCRVGQFVMDSDDPDRAPDLVPVGGTVTIEPDLRRPIRVQGENGPRVVGVDPLDFTIDPTTGKLVHPDGEPGVELIDPTDEHLDPQGWTYTANVKPEKGRAWSVTFGAPTDDSGIVDLGSVVSVAPSPGVAENYLQQTITARDSAESFAVRAETAAQNAEDWAPEFTWDGTRLVIDGEQGPDLEGPPGPGVEGIEDVPGLQTALDGKVSNARIARNIAKMFPEEVAVLAATVTRTGPVVNVSFGARFPEAPPTSTMQLLTFPTGFRPPAQEFAIWEAASTANRISGRVLLSSTGVLTSYASASQSSWGYWSATYLTADPWPVTLPGDPL